MKLRENMILNVLKTIVWFSFCAGGIAFVKERINGSKEEVFSPVHHKGLYEQFIKRPLDCTIATATIIVISPVLIVIALLVQLKLGSPIIFTQERPGKTRKFSDYTNFAPCQTKGMLMEISFLIFIV